MGGRDVYVPQSRGIVERRGLTRTGTWQAVMGGCSTLASVSMFVLIARALGPQDFGTYMFVRWLALVAIPIIGIGMSTLTGRQLAEIQGREAPRLIAGVFFFLWSRQCRCMAFYGVGFLIFAPLASRLFRFCSPLLLLLAALSILPLLLSNIAGITLRSLRRADLLATLRLFGTLTTLLFVIIVRQIGSRQVGTFLLAATLADTLTLTLAIICVVRLLPLRAAQQPGIFLRERLKRGMKHPFLPFALDVIIWQRGELLLLALWRQPAEIGFYAISAIVSSAVISAVPALLSSYILPLLLRYMPAHHYHNAYDAFVKTSCYIVFLAVPCCLLLIVFCPVAITLCLGTAYLPMIEPLRILLIASVFGSIATVSLTRLANAGQHSRHLGIGLGVALLKILLAWFCIARGGMIGAALANSIAQTVSAISSISICRHLLIGHEIARQKDRL